MLGPKPQRAWHLVNYRQGVGRVLDTRFFDQDMSASEIKRQIISRNEHPTDPDTGRSTQAFLVRRNKP